jgi:hypothetical protein
MAHPFIQRVKDFPRRAEIFVDSGRIMLLFVLGAILAGSSSGGWKFN